MHSMLKQRGERTKMLKYDWLVPTKLLSDLVLLCFYCYLFSAYSCPGTSFMAPNILPSTTFQRSCIYKKYWQFSLRPDLPVSAYHSSYFRAVFLSVNIKMCTPWVFFLTLLVLKPEYSWWTKPISWLLMPRLLVSPGHQQPWHRFCMIKGSLSSTRSDFNCMRHSHVGKL